MSVLTKERLAFAALTLVLIGIITYGALWFNSNYVLMPVPREKVQNVEVCIDNDVACSMIYDSKEDIEK